MVHGYILTLKTRNKTDRYLHLADLTDARIIMQMQNNDDKGESEETSTTR
jgi:hypothetical protein